MPERIIPCSRNGALSDAIAKVTRSGQYEWEFVRWTENERHPWTDGVVK